MISHAKPIKFRIKISSCGSDVCNVTYDRMEDESAIILAYIAISNICQDFVGKEYACHLRYELACKLLAGFEKVDIKELEENIKDFKKFDGNWKFKVV